MGLADRVHHKPVELSGGQQQRVGIARALVKDPAILLADEPTGNLDTASSREIMWIIQELNRQSGITVVIVTHERDIAAHAARVVTMLDGKVLDDTRQEPVLRARTRPDLVPTNTILSTKYSIRNSPKCHYFRP